MLLPLFYSTVASSVTPESIGDYWFVAVGCIWVVAISYSVATFTQYCIPIANVQDFRALRIAASFPNIVALPILLLPQLCEFPVVHNGYATKSDESSTPQELEAQCVLQANTMIFCYFFVYMFLFWGFGHPQLMQAAKQRANTTKKEDYGYSTTALTIDEDYSMKGEEKENQQQCVEEPSQQENEVQENEAPTGILQNIWNATKQTLSSAGFIATVLGFITACIPPLQRALFEPEAPLRFLGSAVETLGVASSSISTMVVAASLVPPKNNDENEDDSSNTDQRVEPSSNTDKNTSDNHQRRTQFSRQFSRMSMRNFRDSIRTIKAVTRSTPEMRRLHSWFCLSRLVITPAATVGIILALDCGFDLLVNVPKLSLLVLIINSCLPGALIVVVLLKSHAALEETAMVVAKAYFLSYILSIFTISAWTAVGLYITLPDEDGKTFCHL